MPGGIPDNPFDSSFEQNKEEIKKANDLIAYEDNYNEALKIYNKLAEKSLDEEVRSIYELKAKSIIKQITGETKRETEKEERIDKLFKKNHEPHGEKCGSPDRSCGKVKMDRACKICPQYKEKDKMNINNEII